MDAFLAGAVVVFAFMAGGMGASAGSPDWSWLVAAAVDLAPIQIHHGVWFLAGLRLLKGPVRGGWRPSVGVLAVAFVFTAGSHGSSQRRLWDGTIVGENRADLSHGGRWQRL